MTFRTLPWPVILPQALFGAIGLLVVYGLCQECSSFVYFLGSCLSIFLCNAVWRLWRYLKLRRLRAPPRPVPTPRAPPQISFGDNRALTLLVSLVALWLLLFAGVEQGVRFAVAKVSVPIVQIAVALAATLVAMAITPTKNKAATLGWAVLVVTILFALLNFVWGTRNLSPFTNAWGFLTDTTTSGTIITSWWVVWLIIGTPIVTAFVMGKPWWVWWICLPLVPLLPQLWKLW
jgi:hypothetical protein